MLEHLHLLHQRQVVIVRSHLRHNTTTQSEQLQSRRKQARGQGELGSNFAKGHSRKDKRNKNTVVATLTDDHGHSRSTGEWLQDAPPGVGNARFGVTHSFLSCLLQVSQQGSLIRRAHQADVSLQAPLR